MNIRVIQRSIDNYKDLLGDELSALLSKMYHAASELNYTLDWSGNDEAIKKAIYEGKPALSAEEPVIEVDWLKDAVSKLLKASGDRAEHINLDLLDTADLSHALTDPHATLESIVDSLRADNKELSDQEISNFSLSYSLALSLFGEKVHEALSDTLDKIHVKPGGNCPVCGNPASLAYIEESTAKDGAPKYLWCSTCHYSWRYSRIKCEICGNLKQEDLHYIFAKEKPSHKVHVCEKCGSAFPVVDQGKTSVLSAFEIEEFVMMDIMQDILSQDIDLDEIFGKGKAN